MPKPFTLSVREEQGRPAARASPSPSSFFEYLRQIQEIRAGFEAIGLNRIEQIAAATEAVRQALATRSGLAPPSFPPLPRGLSRTAAARYIGVSPTKFDQLVRDGRMAQPFSIDSLKRWDRNELDSAIDGLAESQPRSWDFAP